MATTLFTYFPTFYPNNPPKVQKCTLKRSGITAFIHIEFKLMTEAKRKEVRESTRYELYSRAIVRESSTHQSIILL